LSAKHPLFTERAGCRFSAGLPKSISGYLRHLWSWMAAGKLCNGPADRSFGVRHWPARSCNALGIEDTQILGSDLAPCACYSSHHRNL